MSILIRKKICVTHKQYLANGINDVEIENLVFLFTDVFFAYIYIYIYLSTYTQIAKSILPTYRKSLKLQKSMKISLLVFSRL